VARFCFVMSRSVESRAKLAARNTSAHIELMHEDKNRQRVPCGGIGCMCSLRAGATVDGAVSIIVADRIAGFRRVAASASAATAERRSRTERRIQDLRWRGGGAGAGSGAGFAWEGCRELEAGRLSGLGSREDPGDFGIYGGDASGRRERGERSAGGTGFGGERARKRPLGLRRYRRLVRRRRGIRDVPCWYSTTCTWMKAT
jgi:hypothetical protein